MDNLQNLTIKSFHDGLIAKEFTAREVAESFFAAIRKKDGEINAYLSLAEASAMREAEATDAMVAKGEAIPDLAGVPLAIKDNILLKGLPATAASKMLEHYVASYDAGVIRRLKKNRAVFLGKANMDEFAMGSSTENSAFKTTHNPHDLTRVPGGTSGGSAAAVAAGMALAALGSDTGGSIRQPAGFCGVVGLKPTYGAVSRSGVIAMASSLDQVGPITKTVEDAAILFKAIAGHDPLDATSGGCYDHDDDHDHGNDLLDPKWEKLKNLTIGLPEEYFVAGTDPAVVAAVERAMEKLKAMSMRFKRISLPHTKYALSTYYIVMPAEVSSNLARFDGIRYGGNSGMRQGASLSDIYFKTKAAGFGPETKRRVILGTFVLSSGYYDAYYEKAQKVRTLIRHDFDEAFKEVDVMLTPVTPTPAFKIGEKVNDPLSMYLSDIFTMPVSLAGLPAVSIPVTSDMGQGTSKKASLSHVSSALSLPVGFQLIGKRWHEADILGIGRFYEESDR